MSETRPPLPPFTRESAAAEGAPGRGRAGTRRDPARVALVYTQDTPLAQPRRVLGGREQVVEFLTRKWARELDYRLIKELWAHDDDRIAVRFAYEWRDDSGQWYRSYGNENWEFDAARLDGRASCVASTTCRSPRTTGGSTGTGRARARSTIRD